MLNDVWTYTVKKGSRVSHLQAQLPDVTNQTPPELVVLVDFKAIYPGGTPGYFRRFPWGGAFLKFLTNLHNTSG
jgi:hypothetical protein